jgi:glycosyltransferase involved in cell wall biosynthesis
MKIAIVAPSPVPFTIGGMEKLAHDIVDRINEMTPHQAELVKYPSKESDFWEVIDSYRHFWKLDLSHFDMVVSTKYPSWMVSHPNHVCYMVHKLRGLYDLYSLMGLPEEVESKSPHTGRLVDFLVRTGGNPDIDLFWGEIEEFRRHKAMVPPKDTRFPGPLIRMIVHYMDNYALSKSRISRYCAMSRTVAARKDYFARDTEVCIAYPPPANIISGPIEYGNYFFTVSRLDNAKRVALLVEAMRQYRGETRLIIAGTGPEEQRLKNLSAGDDRIEFRGYCSDRQVSELYANCLGVLYVPYLEDYGYVVPEAFLRKKPVITCTDSGGTTEFIVDGENGLIAGPDAPSIARAMRELTDSRERAMAMGEKGNERIKGITWDRFIQALLPDTLPVNNREKAAAPRKKIVVTSTFPIFPPLGGGQIRIFNLYRNLSKEYDVDIISFAQAGQPFFEGEIAPGLREIRVAKSDDHCREEAGFDRLAGIPASDVSMPLLSGRTPEFGRRLEAAVRGAFAIVVSHPYLYDEAGKYAGDSILIYEAHNVEYDLKNRMLPPAAKRLLDETFRVEKSCCEKSRLVIACSQEDAARLSELYSVDPSKFVIIPNGVDTRQVQFTPPEVRNKNKMDAGIGDEFLALFIGSWHLPNLEACEEIFRLAEKLPEIKFLLAGSQCNAFQGRVLPRNVGLLGILSDGEKHVLEGLVDIGINPMRSGSGTNLKMYEYMAAGIPVITTRFGARGIDAGNDIMTMVTDPGEMEAAIRDASLSNAGDGQRLKDARKLVESKYDWGVLSRLLLSSLNDKIVDH